MSHKQQGAQQISKGLSGSQDLTHGGQTKPTHYTLLIIYLIYNIYMAGESYYLKVIQVPVVVSLVIWINKHHGYLFSSWNDNPNIMMIY